MVGLAEKAKGGTEVRGKVKGGGGGELVKNKGLYFAISWDCGTFP